MSLIKLGHIIILLLSLKFIIINNIRYNEISIGPFAAISRRVRGKSTMEKKDFERINIEKEKFRYTSLDYVDYEAISDYEICHEHNELILLYGYDKEGNIHKYQWACNDVEKLIKAIDNNKEDIELTFVPKEWKQSLKNIGFQVFAVWNDYFRANLDNLEPYIKPQYLEDHECEMASEVTMSCKGQSRGFTGQSVSWITQWMKGEEPAVSGDTKNSTILVHRIQGKLVGVLCTGIYGHNAEKGPVLWIREVAVHPDFQRKGIGRALINQALNYGKKLGATRAFLAADECNEQAIHLYETSGFVGNKDDGEIVMTRQK